MQEFVSHEVHIGGYVCKELPVVRAEVVGGRLLGTLAETVGGRLRGRLCVEPVFGTPSVAGEEPLALVALRRQKAFGLPEV